MRTCPIRTAIQICRLHELLLLLLLSLMLLASPLSASVVAVTWTSTQY